MDTRVQVLVIRVLVFQNILMALFLWSNRQVSIEEGDGKAREFGVMFIETSAKAGFNIKVRESFIHCCFHKRIKVSSNFGCINGEWSSIFVCANHIVSHIPILTKMLHSFSLSPSFCSFLCSFTFWDILILFDNYSLSSERSPLPCQGWKPFPPRNRKTWLTWIWNLPWTRPAQSSKGEVVHAKAYI